MKICPSCRNGLFGRPSHCSECGSDLGDEPERTGDSLDSMVVGEKYELRSLIGEGAMGWVYEARHLALERSVTIKLLKTDPGTKGVQIARFEREARAVARLSHPHIVTVIDTGRTPGGMLYLVMEYVEGPTLLQILGETLVLPLSRAIGIFQQICAAVEEAHSAQVIHRDLKPENILVSKLRSGEDFTKVLDFGIATLGDETSARATREGLFVGTPGYVAPENITGGRPTEQTDVYSLGIILYQLLTGREPFDEEDPMKLLRLHLEEPPPPLARTAPFQSFTDGVQGVVDRALEKDPAARFSNVADLRSAIFAAVGEMGPVRLACNQCSRPVNPLTGFCSLHSAAPLPNVWVSAAARNERPTETPPTRSTKRSTPQKQDTDWRALIAMIAGPDSVRLQGAAEEIAQFLIGEQRLLEIVGPLGSGKTSLIEGATRAASQLGLRTFIARGDPRLTLSPWYPVRELVGEILGIGPTPDSKDVIHKAAQQESISEQLIEGLFELFHVVDPTEDREETARLNSLRAAAFGVLSRGAGESTPTCYVFDGIHRCDRATQSFVRGLAAIGNGWPHKIVLTSESSTTSEPEGHPVVQLAARDENELRELVRSRLDDLPDDASELARVISALGRDVSPSLLAAFIDQDQLYLALEILSQRGFLVVGPSRAVSPSDAQLAEAVLDAMPRAERTQLYERIFRGLDSKETSPFLLARLAEEGELDEPSMDLLERIGDLATRWLDHETAAMVHLRRAQLVARWRLLIAEDDERYLRLMLKQAAALLFAGHHLSAEVVLKDILSSARSYPQITDRARQLLNRAE